MLWYFEEYSVFRRRCCASVEDFLDCADFFGGELAGGGGGAGAGVGDAGAEGFAADPGDGSEGAHGHGDHGTGGGGLHFLGDVQEVYHVLEGLGHYGKFEDVGAGVFQGFEDFPHLVFFRGFVEVVAGGDDQAVLLVDVFYQISGIQTFILASISIRSAQPDMAASIQSAV